jgi:hypothetical protein
MSWLIPHLRAHVFTCGFPRKHFLTNRNKSVNDFSIPNLEEWFLMGHTNTLNLEHTFLLTYEVAEEILLRNGFSILHRENFRDTHSIFIAAIFIYVSSSDQDITLETLLYAHPHQLPLYQDKSKPYCEMGSARSHH